MEKEYECDHCGRELEWEEVGYLGPIDRGDCSCSPFLPMEVVCLSCEESVHGEE